MHAISHWGCTYTLVWGPRGQDWVCLHICLNTKRTECTYTLVWGPGGQDWVYLHTCLRTRTGLGVLVWGPGEQNWVYLYTCLRTRRTRLGVLTHLFEDQQDRTGCTYTLVWGPGGQDWVYLHTCLRARRTGLVYLFEDQENRTGCTYTLIWGPAGQDWGVLTHLFEDQEDRTGCTYTLVWGPGGTPPRTARSCSLGCPARCRDSRWGRAPSRLPPLHSWFAAGTKLDSMKKMTMPACQKPLPDPPRAKHILVT